MAVYFRLARQLLLGLLLSLALAACGAEQPVAPPPGTPAPVAPGDDSLLRAIATNPAAYEGQPVTLLADVTMLFGPRAFRLSEPALHSDAHLLAVSAAPDLVVTWGATVEVTGVVRPFDRAALAAELDADLDDERLAAIAPGSPVLVVATLTAAPGAPEVGETLSDIAFDPLAFAGKTVTISGLLDAVLGPRVLRLEDPPLNDPRWVLVVLTDETTPASGALPPGLELGARLEVTGEVRTFDRAALERELGVALEGADLETYTNHAAIIATRVRALP